MKTTESLQLYNPTWQSSVIHYTFISIFIILIIVIPILYTQTGAPPYWAIYMIFGLLLLFYSIYWVILITYRKSHHATNTVNNLSAPANNNTSHTIHMMEDEIIRLQQQEEEDDDTTVETSYNPSTVGIPPSSFLAPTINQQASVRSSSLDYAPPPPAYQDMMIYPPSYRSTNSTKDDNTSTSVTY